VKKRTQVEARDGTNWHKKAQVKEETHRGDHHAYSCHP
jgi:hypothetical protein